MGQRALGCLGGGRAVIIHWDGTAWATGPSPNGSLLALWGSGPGNVWAVGYDLDGALLLHFSGGVWTREVGVPVNSLLGVWGSGPNDVWVVGDAGNILRWNGTNWNMVPDTSAADLYDVWGSSADDIWRLFWRSPALGRNGVDQHGKRHV